MSGTRSLTKPPARSKSSRRTAPAPVQERAANPLIGLPPRVDLLPKEVRNRGKQRSVRNSFVLGAILAIVVVGGGYVFASYLVGQSTVALEAEQARTTDLLAQQAEFVEVRQVQQRVLSSEATSRVARSTEIDWLALSLQVAKALPPGVGLTAIKTDSATPILAFSTPADPLIDSSIAFAQYTAASPTLPDAAAWIEGIQKIRGVAGASVAGIVLTDGVYVVDLTIYLDESRVEPPVVDETEATE